MAQQGSKRAIRVAGQVQAELMDLVLRGAVRDPNAQGVLVTEVQVTDDLGEARVYIRLQEPADDRRREAAVQAMSRAAGYLRRELGQRLRLRRIPELAFYWDQVIDEAQRIESLLDEIRREDEGEPE